MRYPVDRTKFYFQNYSAINMDIISRHMYVSKSIGLQTKNEKMSIYTFIQQTFIFQNNHPCFFVIVFIFLMSYLLRTKVIMGCPRVISFIISELSWLLEKNSSVVPRCLLHGFEFRYRLVYTEGWRVQSKLLFNP